MAAALDMPVVVPGDLPGSPRSLFGVNSPKPVSKRKISLPGGTVEPSNSPEVADAPPPPPLVPGRAASASSRDASASGNASSGGSAKGLLLAPAPTGRTLGASTTGLDATTHGGSQGAALPGDKRRPATATAGSSGKEADGGDAESKASEDGRVGGGGGAAAADADAGSRPATGSGLRSGGMDSPIGFGARRSTTGSFSAGAAATPLPPGPPKPRGGSATPAADLAASSKEDSDGDGGEAVPAGLASLIQQSDRYGRQAKTPGGGAATPGAASTNGRTGSQGRTPGTAGGFAVGGSSTPVPSTPPPRLAVRTPLGGGGASSPGAGATTTSPSSAPSVAASIAGAYSSSSPLPAPSPLVPRRAVVAGAASPAAAAVSTTSTAAGAPGSAASGSAGSDDGTWYVNAGGARGSAASPGAAAVLASGGGAALPPGIVMPMALPAGGDKNYAGGAVAMGQGGAPMPLLVPFATGGSGGTLPGGGVVYAFPGIAGGAPLALQPLYGMRPQPSFWSRLWRALSCRGGAGSQGLPPGFTYAYLYPGAGAVAGGAGGAGGWQAVPVGADGGTGEGIALPPWRNGPSSRESSSGSVGGGSAGLAASSASVSGGSAAAGPHAGAMNSPGVVSRHNAAHSAALMQMYAAHGSAAGHAGHEGAASSSPITSSTPTRPPSTPSNYYNQYGGPSMPIHKQPKGLVTPLPPPRDRLSVVRRPSSTVGQGPLLGPQLPADTGKVCLVLDLDETLVHSSFKPVPNADYVLPVEIDGIVHSVYVLKRPGCDTFLQRLGDKYEIIVFTASLAKYADPLLDLLDTHNVIRGRLFREACVLHEGSYVKDLSILGRDPGSIIIVDNSPASYLFQPENALPCESFIDDPKDTELFMLLEYLELTWRVGDVREALLQWVTSTFVGVNPDGSLIGAGGAAGAGGGEDEAVYEDEDAEEEEEEAEAEGIAAEEQAQEEAAGEGKRGEAAAPQPPGRMSRSSSAAALGQPHGVKVSLHVPADTTGVSAPGALSPPPHVRVSSASSHRGSSAMAATPPAGVALVPEVSQPTAPPVVVVSGISATVQQLRSNRASLSRPASGAPPAPAFGAPASEEDHSASAAAANGSSGGRWADDVPLHPALAAESAASAAASSSSSSTRRLDLASTTAATGLPPVLPAPLVHSAAASSGGSAAVRLHRGSNATAPMPLLPAAASPPGGSELGGGGPDASHIRKSSAASASATGAKPLSASSSSLLAPLPLVDVEGAGEAGAAEAGISGPASPSLALSRGASRAALIPPAGGAPVTGNVAAKLTL